MMKNWENLVKQLRLHRNEVLRPMKVEKTENKIMFDEPRVAQQSGFCAAPIPFYYLRPFRCPLRGVSF